MSLARMPRRLRRALAPLLIAVAVLAAAQPAMAVTWYSSSAPLKVTQDGVAQGLAYGNFVNNNGVSAQQRSQQKDPRAGGDNIYVETSFYFYEPCGDGSSTEWCYYDYKQTDRTSYGYWYSDYTAKYLSGNSEKARAQTKVCEDHNWAKDPCSANVIRTFSY